MKIILLYFSATGNTEKITNRIKEKLLERDTIVEEFNLADRSNRKKIFDFDKYQGAIFGFPIYGGRIPKIMRDWIMTLEGRASPCATFFTYGGVQTGISHYHTKRLLNNRDFIVIESAEFLGRHTFNNAGWNLMEDRPDSSDLVVAETFAENLLQKLVQSDLKNLELKKPKTPEKKYDRLDKTFNALPTPSKNGLNCDLCKTCENLCPTKAINATTGEVDKDICIRCFRCVVNCPRKALTVKDMSNHMLVIEKANNLTDDILRERKSRIIL